MRHMELLAQDIWIFEGRAVQFMGFPFSTRMTVIRLSNDELWIHSPIELSDEIMEQISMLGRVKYLIAPNHLHHLFLLEWIESYPDVEVYGTSEVIKKRSDISFSGTLDEESSKYWSGEIEQELFTGSPVMEECVFYHRSSGTLIVTDLIENFSGKDFKYWQKLIAKGVGILAPNGKMPLDWRLTFLFSQSKARKHLNRILAWRPHRLVMSHGEIIREGADEFLVRSFKWLV